MSALDANILVMSFPCAGQTISMASEKAQEVVANMRITTVYAQHFCPAAALSIAGPMAEKKAD